MAGRALRFKLVLQQSQEVLNRAAEAYESAQRFVQAEQQKLEELREYHADYQTSFATCRVTRATDVARQRAFLQKLADAIAQQTATLAQMVKALEQKKSVWRQAHLKHKALSEFVERALREDRRDLERKEEKLLDEWTAAQSRKIAPS